MNDRELVIVGDQAFTEAEWEYKLRRLERRRAQYRDSKRRAKLRDDRPQPVGWFHSLACSGNGHRRKPSCIPIPAYRSALRLGWPPRSAFVRKVTP